MPHIIVEYSDALSDDVDFQVLIEEMHSALSEYVEAARIKSRAVKIEHYSVGKWGKSGSMVHITLLLLEGRDVATKKLYAQALYDLAKRFIGDELSKCSLTLEVRDMVKETYILA